MSVETKSVGTSARILASILRVPVGDRGVSGAPEMSLRETLVLLEAAAGATTPMHLCRALPVGTASGVTRALTRLEKLGLAERNVQHIDRRQVTVRVTPAGMALVRSMARAARDLDLAA